MRRLLLPCLLLAAGVAAAGVFSGCLHACTDMGCIGTIDPLPLVDDSGAATGARGEFRVSLSPTSATTRPFACAEAARPSEFPRCEGGLLSLPLYDVRPEYGVDIRFELANGSLSEWQPVALELTRHTDPDFNGEDCPCSWYDASVEPVVVPAEARLPVPGAPPN